MKCARKKAGEAVMKQNRKARRQYAARLAEPRLGNDRRPSGTHLPHVSQTMIETFAVNVLRRSILFNENLFYE
jgi:hypothetical protein